MHFGLTLTPLPLWYNFHDVRDLKSHQQFRFRYFPSHNAVPKNSLNHQKYITYYEVMVTKEQ